MGFFDRMAEAGKSLLADVERATGRITGRETLNRVCQAAFLIARADGTFDPSEKAMLQRLVAAKLPQFTGADISAAIDAATAELEFSVDGGIQMLLASIAKAKGTDQAPLIMLVAVAIAAADGDFDDAEKAVARQIAAVLGVDPSGYGL